MGSSTSKYEEDIGAVDIAEFVASLGNNFKPYEDAIRKAGINGKELAIMSDEELEKVLDSLSVVNRLHRRKLASVCRKQLKKNPEGDCDTSSTSSSSSNRINFSSSPPSAGARLTGGEDSSLAGSVGTSSSCHARASSPVRPPRASSPPRPLARASSPVPPAGPSLPMPGLFENMCVAQSFEALSLLVNMENQKRLLTQDNRPKGPPENTAAIVLTDVQGSTSLWEADPKAMRSALNTHDEIIRGLRADHGGYEIDTEGDAFFLAFHTAKDAIAFAISLQENLRDADWNDDILAQPDACDFMGMRGLRVRMGIHFGPVTKRNNAVTGRLEYTGETLKIAQKVEGMADGGDILTTRSTFEASGSNAKIEDMGDGIVKVLVARNTSRFRSNSLGNGSVHSLNAMDSAAKRLSEGRKKRQTSMNKSITRDNASFTNQSLRPKRTLKKRERAIRPCKSMTDAEAAIEMEGRSTSISSQQNFQWGVKT